MLEDVRKYMEAALGSLNQSRAREMAGSLMRGQPAERVNRFAQELLGWSQRTRERITELVQAEVKKQMRVVGLATRDDLDTLRARVRELEKGSSSRSASGSAKRASSSKRSTAKRSTAKRSSAKKSGARKSTARTSTAKRSPSGSSSYGSSGSTSPGSGSSGATSSGSSGSTSGSSSTQPSGSSSSGGGST
jgi:polyhydroxyalkanoate synthesis regulator phasin